MSYSIEKEYTIKPKNAYEIIRNCQGCAKKSIYENTNHFRVNANGNRIDIWLIYQCKKCKHTFNLDIYTRVNPKSISSDIYSKFFNNDKELASTCGKTVQLFKNNKAEIDIDSIEYGLYDSIDNEIIDKYVYLDNKQENHRFVIKNPYLLKLRDDKLITMIYSISRSKAKQLLEEGRILINNINNKTIEIITIVQ